MATTPRPLAPIVPVTVGVLGALALAWIITPVLALGVRVPWGRIGDIATDPETGQLLWVTLASAVLSTLITLVLGIPLAMLLQHAHKGAAISRLLVLLPLAMPPVVSGLALTALIGRRGLLAPVLDFFGLQFAFAFPGVVASHVFVSLPFVVVTLDAALRQINPEIPASAAGVGLSPGQISRKILAPALAPSIAMAAGLAFARSLGEFGTTLTFAGSMPGVTRTMSLGIYLEREVDQEAAYALSTILIGLAVCTLILAFLPGLLRRSPTPAAREIGAIDTQRLRELTRPTAPSPTVTFNGTTMPAHHTTAIIGANGSGKTTLASLIAGRLQGATVQLGQRFVDKPGMRPTPAYRRGVVMLTQQPGLPRTTTVSGAITMVTRDEQRTRALIDAAGLSALHDVPVPALSGGQAAQVALVRALAARPAVLIADEPLAAVDAASARGWRQVLRATATDRTTLMITHNPLDIAGLSQHVVVVENGSVISSRPTAEELAVPSNDFVAGLAGINRLRGKIVDTADQILTVNAGGTAIYGVAADDVAQQTDLVPGAPVVVTFSPAATTVRLPSLKPGHEGMKESARNLWPGTVESVENTPGEAQVNVRVDIGVGSITVPVTRESVLELGLEPGVQVECITKALNVTVHPDGA